MKRILTVLAVLLMATENAYGQISSYREGYADLRVGGVFADKNNSETETNHLSVGLDLGGYLGTSGRVSLNFSFDYLPLSRDDFYAPELGDMVRIREHGFLFGPSVGFDVIQSEGGYVTLSAGITASGYWQTFSLRNRWDQWENVCHLNVFRGDCSSKWELLTNYGVGAKMFVTENAYLGAVFTRYSNRRNQFVATLGATF